MKKIYLFLVLFSLPSISFGNTFQQTTVNGITFQNVIYNINDGLYKIHVASGDIETNIDDLAIRNNAITGINGIFFCPRDYSACKGRSFTINERIVDGIDTSYYPDTGERAIFGWDINGTPKLHQTGKINIDTRNLIFEGMGNFPILYSNGVNMLEHYHDIGLYDSKMRAKMKRHFICSNQEKTQIFFGSTSPTSLDNLAPALFELGCWDGINLDAGSSTQYLYNGRRILHSGRNILDGFVIERIGLNISELENKVTKAMDRISPIYKQYPKEIAIKKIENILKIISTLRADIYEKNSIDIFNKQGKEVGYQIDINSLSTLRSVYLINKLERRLQTLKREIEN